MKIPNAREPHQTLGLSALLQSFFLYIYIYIFSKTHFVPNINCQQTGVAHPSGINNLKPEKILSGTSILLDTSQNYMQYQDTCLKYYYVLNYYEDTLTFVIKVGLKLK